MFAGSAVTHFVHPLLRARGWQDRLVSDVHGHALTLNLLGRSPRDAHGGDVRRRDRVRLAEAEAAEQAGHAFRVLEVYERWFEQKETKGTKADEEAKRKGKGKSVKGRGKTANPSVSTPFVSFISCCSELAAIASLFERPWSCVSIELTEGLRAWLLNEAGLAPCALGRLTEALEPMWAGLEMRVAQPVWESAAIIATNLSELELRLGSVPAAVRDAERSVAYADRIKVEFLRLGIRTGQADALHQLSLLAGNQPARFSLPQESPTCRHQTPEGRRAAKALRRGRLPCPEPWR